MNELVAILQVVSEGVGRSGLRVLLIGGLAVNHYGYARSTADVDFMVALAEKDEMDRMLREAGFTNIERLKHVVFFRKPDMKVRVDMLKVDDDTFKELWSRSVKVEETGYHFRLPALPDLLAMKLFALKNGWDRRVHKDLPDVAHLAVINHMDPEKDIRPLCAKFADEDVFNRVVSEMSLLQS